MFPSSIKRQNISNQGRRFLLNKPLKEMLLDFDILSVFLYEDTINKNVAYVKIIFCAYLVE